MCSGAAWLMKHSWKYRLNSDTNMHLADRVKDSPHPGVSYLWHQSRPLLGAGPQLSKPGGRQIKGTKRRRCFTPACAKKDFAENTVRPENSEAEASGTSAALPEAAGCPVPSSQHPGLGASLANQKKKTTEGRLRLLKTLGKLLLSNVNICWQEALGK